MNLFSSRPLIELPHLQQIRLEHDTAQHALWCYLRPPGRPCVTFELLDELRELQEALQRSPAVADGELQFLLLCSDRPVFNLGGDLELFIECVERRDHVTLQRYAHACVDVLYNNAVGLGFPVTTIAVLSGDAMGGGLEAALSCRHVIAERQVHLGFPEILFNLLPGMGGYPLLARRVGTTLAEKIIMGGINYTAEQARTMGLIDSLAEPGQAEVTARRFVARANTKAPAQRLLEHFRMESQTLDRAAMLRMTDAWVDAAIDQPGVAIRNMSRLLDHQAKFMLPGGEVREPQVVSEYASAV